ncbi:SPOR domain-containing protein [Leptothrix ochracea]|uniref:SPOR domain-containing protein n=1 Tax=Leptothrix ochracea TaxID=735331 RepID=UPI0034E2F566
MGFLSFLQRKNKPTGSVLSSGAADVVQLEHLRVRARHRLIGAVVLVAGAVLVLPRVFDSPPRPLSAGSGVKIEMVGGAGGVASASVVASVSPSASASEAPQSSVTASVTTTKSAASQPLGSAASKSVVAVARPPALASPLKVPASPPPVVSHPTKTEAARAQALLEGHDERKAAAKSEVTTRFFVQLGAFEQASAARDMRQRVDQLGLKAHEQELTTASGRRIRVRVGPYSSREEANAVMARMRASGLQPAIMVQ